MRVLLTSVFGPFAQDDAYGSRAINPPELYHNQVRRAQGPFSLRMHHRSWGIMLIQANITAPSTLLDFPTRERFIEELKAHQYDVVGISGIIVNIGTTSSLFGGKGRFVNFFETGQQLFDIMCESERTLRVNTFFMMDENFL